MLMKHEVTVLKPTASGDSHHGAGPCMTLCDLGKLCDRLCLVFTCAKRRCHLLHGVLVCLIWITYEQLLLTKKIVPGC